MTRLILIRHGQSMANFEEKFAGHSDFDLSELGRKQAELAAKYLLETEKIDAIYASDLLRAYNTAVPSARAFGLEITPDTRLREIFAGEWEGLTFSDIAEKFPDDFYLWKHDFSNARCTGGESVAEVYTRVSRDICDIAEKNEGKTLLIATHATVVRAFTCFARGFDATKMADVPFCYNSAINIFTFDGGKATIEKTNIHEFLGELSTAVPAKIRA